MLELVVMIVALIAAVAWMGAGASERFDHHERAAFGRGQASIRLGDLLGTMLGSVFGGRWSALAAALARPAPADARQACLPDVRLAIPPGGPHGGWPDAPRGRFLR